MVQVEMKELFLREKGPVALQKLALIYLTFKYIQTNGEGGFPAVGRGLFLSAFMFQPEHVYALQSESAQSFEWASNLFVLFIFSSHTLHVHICLLGAIL